MPEITLIFDTKGGSAKERAIKIAERYDPLKEKDKIKVVFPKANTDLITLIELCKQWPSSELLIDGNDLRLSEVLKILKCSNKNDCEGFCLKGNGLDFNLKREIENASKGIYDEFFGPDDVRENVAQIKGIKKEKNGSYRVNKSELKKNLLIDYNLPLQVCEKIDREGMIKYIENLPETFEISDGIIDSRSDCEGFSDDRVAEFTEQAEIMGPIIGKHIAREIDKVFIANLGSEKDSRSCERKGECLFELGRYDESVACFDKALVFDQKNAGALFGKAIAFFYDDKFQSALKPLDEYLTLEPDNPRGWKLKGEILENLGKFEDSQKCFRRSLDFFTQELEDDPDCEGIPEEIDFVNGKIQELKKNMIVRS